MNQDGGSKINVFIERLGAAIDQGFDAIAGDVNMLLAAMLTVSIIFLGMRIAFGEVSWGPVLRQIFLMCFVAFLIYYWRELIEGVARSFTQLGIKAGGSSWDVDRLHNPGELAMMGVSAADVLIREANKRGGWGFFENFGIIIFLLIAALLIIAAYVVLAFQLFLTIIKLKLGALVAFVLMPFAILSKTSFLAERPLAWAVGMGLRLMIIAIIIGITESVYQYMKLPPGTRIDFVLVISMSIGALLILVLAVSGPSLANDLISGSPNLGGGLDAATAAGAGRAGAAAVGVAGGFPGIRQFSQGIGSLGSGAMKTIAAAGMTGADKLSSATGIKDRAASFVRTAAQAYDKVTGGRTAVHDSSLLRNPEAAAKAFASKQSKEPPLLRATRKDQQSS